MTCEDFRSLYTRDFMTLLPSERLASAHHYEKCVGCKEFHKVTLARELELHKITPEEKAIIRAVVGPQMAALRLLDSLDPELRGGEVAWPQ